MKKALRYRRVLRMLRIVFGWAFLVLGIAGLFLPVLQGLIFIALGIALLARHIPLFSRLRNRFYARFPATSEFVRRTRQSLRRRRKSLMRGRKRERA